MLVRERMAAGHIQARGGGGDDVEWGVDLRALVGGDAQRLAEEGVDILEGLWT